MLSQASLCPRGGGGGGVVYPRMHLGRGCTPAWHPHDGHCSGWYAFYWNAFLFLSVTIIVFNTVAMATVTVTKHVLAFLGFAE